MFFITTLVTHIAAIAASTRQTPDSWHYLSPEALLLEQGMPYPLTKRPDWLPMGMPKKCFGNSLLLAEWFGLQYVEGYALLWHPETRESAAMPHAWLSDASGNAYEVTADGWAAYFGMPFSVAYADDCSWHGDASCLHDHKRQHPLLRQPWVGTPTPRPGYRPSPHLKTLRKMKRRGESLWGLCPSPMHQGVSRVQHPSAR